MDHTELKPPPLPAVLRRKLEEHRRRMWQTKTLEVGFAAAFGLVVSYLAVYGLDRVMETPALLRLGLLALGVVGALVFLPRQLRRWVFSKRSLEQVARQVATKDVALGDHLLGILELTHNQEEFRRSPELCRAAVAQGEQTLRSRDLTPALPTSLHARWAAAFAAPALLAAVLVGSEPAIGGNAFLRWIAPFADVERYTYARVEDLPESVVVALQERAVLELSLAADSRRSPRAATLSFAGTDIEAQLSDGRYAFLIPPLADDVEMSLRLGDLRGEILVQPTERPEASDLIAEVQLPAYLELPEPRRRDVRAGSLRVVEGASYTLEATMIRDIAEASVTIEVDGQAQDPAAARVEGSRITSGPRLVTAGESLALTWIDTLGLAGHDAFELGVRVREDDDPVVHTEGARPDLVLLESTALVFDVKASDDFGVRTVGLEWEGAQVLRDAEERTRGEKTIAAGQPDSQQLTALATFHPQELGIAPQLIQLRAWAVDALPGRPRSYSQVINVRIMTAEEHMIWMTNQLTRWYDEAVEVRDVELGLRAENVALHELSNAELDRADNRKRIQRQARAERSNSMRLSSLVRNGEGLLTEAARNPEFNSNTLDDWAEMMAALGDIASKRMPSVASLLTDAASQPGKTPSRSGRQAGADRGSSAGPGSANESRSQLGQNPSVQDRESSFNEAGDRVAAGGEGTQSNQAPAPLRLATTSVTGGGPPGDPNQEPDSGDAGEDEAPSMTKEELARAIAEQNALIEEFDKVAGLINEVLENLEGSTFVKRLKAASRLQTGVASDLTEAVGESFGLQREEIEDPGYDGTVASVVERETDGKREASVIQSDLNAYVDRLEARGSDFGKFQKVLEEMTDLGLTAHLVSISNDTEGARPGAALVNAEFWADTFDRWAEQLIGPG